MADQQGKSTATPGDDAARLSRAVARGDREALGEFYNAWFDRCFHAARQLTGRDESFCLDVVQDAMIRAVRAIRPLQSEEELGAWMYKVVRSAALDRLRRDARRTRREAASTVPAPDSSAGPDAGLALEEETAWVRAALEASSPEDRALVAERFGRDRTLQEAGALAGMSGAAAHGRLRRTLVRLRSLAREVFDER